MIEDIVKPVGSAGAKVQRQQSYVIISIKLQKYQKTC